MFEQERSSYSYSGNWKNGKKEDKGILKFIWRIYLDKNIKNKYHLKCPGHEIKTQDYQFSIEFKGIFNNDVANSTGTCLIYKDNKVNKQDCIFKNGVLVSKLKLPNNIILKVSK